MAILISALVNLGYLGVGVLALWCLVQFASHNGITGKSFHLGTWLDAIADSDALGIPGPKADRIGMAIVVAGLLAAGAFVVAPFIRG